MAHEAVRTQPGELDPGGRMAFTPLLEAPEPAKKIEGRERPWA